VFADDNGVELPVGAGLLHVGVGRRGVGAKAAGLTGVEALGNDDAVSGDHDDGVVVLPLA
jgi:hypothetical protein